MRILDVRLRVGEGVEEATRRFYLEKLGLPADGVGIRIGHTRLEFEGVRGEEPFYHFALRVPRNRYASARAWIAAHAKVLDEARFENWEADACYFEDPAGNIVELITHGSLPEEGPDGLFTAGELLGVCELGVVGPDTRPMAEVLDPIGIHLSDGSLEPGRLAFMGSREGVLILSPEGRGWMPTGRPAEPHAVEATVTAARAGEVALPGTRHRIRTVPSG
jgi:catechol 2,3-dioxygenase-like lactoylglutathione lyase family enzyme